MKDEEQSLTTEIRQMLDQPSQTSDDSKYQEDEEDDELLKQLHKSSKSASLFNFVNSSLGSGVLTIPYNYKSSGYVGGLVLQLIFILLSTLSYNILIKTANHSHRFQYDQVSNRIFPKYVGLIAISMQLLFSAGCLISYIVVIRDNFFWWNDDQMLYQDLLTSGILLLLILPLCWLKNLNALKFNSYLVVGCILYVDVVCIYELIDKTINNDLETEKLQIVNWSDLPFAIPLFTQAYCAQYNFLNIYRELTHRKKNGNKIVYENQAIISLIYLSIGIFGYISFTDETQPDILSNLADSGNVLAQIGNVLIIIMMICHYPLPVYSMRLAIEGLLQTCSDKKNLENINKYLQKYSRFITSTLLIIVCLAIALCLSSIDQILNFTSSIAGCSLGYILPGMFGIRMGQLFSQKQEIIIGIILIICGTAFMCLGLYAAVNSLL